MTVSSFLEFYMYIFKPFGLTRNDIVDPDVFFFAFCPLNYIVVGRVSKYLLASVYTTG